MGDFEYPYTSDSRRRNREAPLYYDEKPVEKRINKTTAFGAIEINPLDDELSRFRKVDPDYIPFVNDRDPLNLSRNVNYYQPPSNNNYPLSSKPQYLNPVSSKPSKYNPGFSKEPTEDRIVVVNRDYLERNRAKPPSYGDDNTGSMPDFKIKRDEPNGSPSKMNRDPSFQYDNKPISEFKIKRGADDGNKRQEPVNFDETPIKPMKKNPYVTGNFDDKEDASPRKNTSSKKTTSFDLPKDTFKNSSNNKKATKSIEKLEESFEKMNVGNRSYRKEIVSPRKAVNVNSAFVNEGGNYYNMLPQSNIVASQPQLYLDPVTQQIYADPNTAGYQPQYYLDPQTQQVYADPNTASYQPQYYLDPQTQQVYADPGTQGLQQPQVQLINPNPTNYPPPIVVNPPQTQIQPVVVNVPVPQPIVMNAQAPQQYVMSAPPPQLSQQPMLLNTQAPPQPIILTAPPQQPNIIQTIDPVAQSNPSYLYSSTVPQTDINYVAYQVPGSQAVAAAPKQVNYEIIKRKNPLKTYVHHYFKE